MSKSKIVGMMALIAFTMGIVLVGNAVAGEKIKCRTVYYNTKWNQVNVGDEKDHVVAMAESKGIISNKEGKTFGDGWLAWTGGLYDLGPKGPNLGDGYMTLTDKDGDKIYMKWAQKPTGSNPWTFYKGTGKFEGVKGRGTWFWTPSTDPTLFYTDWEGEVELPR